MESKTIYCPICHRTVGRHDMRSQTNTICKCRKCEKRIIYHYDTGETEAKRLPQRDTSSGVCFV